VEGVGKFGGVEGKGESGCFLVGSSLEVEEAEALNSLGDDDDK